MLDALKFVRGAVAKKDYQPALTHFRISGGRVLGFNGTIALSSPIDLDIDASPEATPFAQAIERCQSETTAIHITDGGRLALKSGRFKAYIECHPDSEVLDSIRPEGEEIVAPGNVLTALETLSPFVGVDASRPWALGVLFRNHSAFATNNIIIAEYWLGEAVPQEINIPSQAIKEILRIGIEPERLTLSENNLTFHFPGDRWLRTQLLSTDWPDVSPILDLPCNPLPFPDGFFDAVETLSPFVDQAGRVYFRGDRMTTSAEDGEGAAVELAPLPEKGAFNHKYLSSLGGIATGIDFTPYPNPCGFRGKLIRGAIMGMRE
jgi:DNA polymerase III sliding clamp (beta) subunit (PCNA family)